MIRHFLPSGWTLPARARRPAAQPVRRRADVRQGPLQDPDGTRSRLLAHAIADRSGTGSTDFRFAAAVAGFGMLLRDSPHSGAFSLNDVVKPAENGKGDDPRGYRGEFIRLVEATRDLGLLKRETDGS